MIDVFKRRFLFINSVAGRKFYTRPLKFLFSWVYSRTQNNLAAAFAAGIVYLLTLIASGTIGRKELQKLPVIGSRFK